MPIPTDPATTKPVLLCFDGSEDASNAIAAAGRLFGPRTAVVLTVCEPTRLWSPTDPATILDAPIGKLLANTLELDEIGHEVAQDEVERGLELARAAGFRAQGRVANGKAWRAICEVADELDAAAIVLGARGLSRVQSALMGSVSAAVSVHGGRPVLIVHRPAVPTKPIDETLTQPVGDQCPARAASEDDGTRRHGAASPSFARRA